LFGALCVAILSFAPASSAVRDATSHQLYLSVEGAGTVQLSTGLKRHCISVCVIGKSLPVPSPVTITITPAAGWRVLAWRGACRGAKLKCVLRIVRTAHVTIVLTPLPGPGPIVGQGYHLAFHDEFMALNRRVWDNHIWYDDPPSAAWADFQTVHDGELDLKTSRKFIGSAGDPYPQNTVTTFSSGKSFTYGYFEARMKWTHGAGAWPAFWLISTGWAKTGSCATPAGELDVFEGQGTEPTVFYGTVHKESADACGGDAQNDNNYQPVRPDLTSGFHTYAALWTAAKVSWYLDGRLVASAEPYSTDNQPMFLLLQMWTGGWTSDPTAATPTDLHTEVDWVRVWQK
jgi:hypothetical protein